jgi:hypothetical protein
VRGPIKKVYGTFGQETGGQIARNIPFLTKAVLTDCGLTRHIMDNFSVYSQLTELDIDIGPKALQKIDKSTTLKTLKWNVLNDNSQDHDTDDFLNTAASVIEVAGTVFPDLVELDISNFGKRVAALHPLTDKAIEHKQSVMLPRLQSFHYKVTARHMDRETIVDFIRTNHKTLSLLEVAFCFDHMDQEVMDYLSQIVAAAPRLKSFTIPCNGRGERWQSHKFPVWSNLIHRLDYPAEGIEFFELWNIGCSFSASIGQLFSGWKNLRVLKIGAPLYEIDEHDGRPHFDDIAPVSQLLDNRLHNRPCSCYIGTPSVCSKPAPIIGGTLYRARQHCTRMRRRRRLRPHHEPRTRDLQITASTSHIRHQRLDCGHR